jgi:ribokinase
MGSDFGQTPEFPGRSIRGRRPDGSCLPDPTQAYDRCVRPRITVVGSVNLDLVVRLARLPRPGETVTGASFSRHPGGKGANQALACARLGAEVTLIAAVGRDAFADEALALLRHEGVDLLLSEMDRPTGVALIAVDDAGETTIAVAPGANDTVGAVTLPEHDAVLCQLEISDAAVTSAWEQCTGLFCLNAAPARPVAVDPELTVVNRYELDALTRQDGLIALTLGADGAALLDGGEEIARAEPPAVTAVDGTGAGDAFAACLLVSLLEGRANDEALRRACAAGALAASRLGAQPSLPSGDEIDTILGT